MKCPKCSEYKAPNGKTIRRLCDEHLAKRLARIRKRQPKWHPTKNPISRMLRFAVVAALLIGSVQAEPRHHRSRNYILRRQEIGAVSGVPTTRRIIGRREIDIYPSGLMFEKDNVVGVLPRR